MTSCIDTLAAAFYVVVAFPVGVALMAATLAIGFIRAFRNIWGEQ